MEILSEYNEELVTAGMGKSVNMTMSNSAHLFSLLSTKLYKEPIKAGVREIITNAWDAHLDCGNLDPIAISTDSGSFTIRDFGKGIPKEDFLALYSVVGGTNKQDKQNQTGGMGIGKMAPLAFLDYFTVISYSQGYATTYSIAAANSPGEVPSITEIFSTTSDEPTGLEITFVYENVRSLMEIAKDIVLTGSINAEQIIDGEPVTMETVPDDDVVLIKTRPYISYSSLIRYGNISYPVRLSSLGLANKYSKKVQDLLMIMSAGVILKAQPGKVQITPNREEIILTGTTLSHIEELFNNFYDEMGSHLDSIIKKLPVDKLRFTPVQSHSIHNIATLDELVSDPGILGINTGIFFSLTDEVVKNYCSTMPTKLLDNYAYYSYLDTKYKVDNSNSHFLTDFTDLFDDILKTHGLYGCAARVGTCNGTALKKHWTGDRYEGNFLNILMEGNIRVYTGATIPRHDMEDNTLYVKAFAKTDKEALLKELQDLFHLPDSNVKILEPVKKKAVPVRSKRTPPRYRTWHGKPVFKDGEAVITEKPDYYIPFERMSLWGQYVPESLYKDKVVAIADTAQEYNFDKRTRTLVPNLITSVQHDFVVASLKDPEIKEFLETLSYQFFFTMSRLLFSIEREHFKKILKRTSKKFSLPLPKDLERLCDLLVCTREWGEYNSYRKPSGGEILLGTEEHAKILFSLFYSLPDCTLSALASNGMLDNYLNKTLEKL